MEYGASDQGQWQKDMTMKTEEEGPDTSSVYIKIDLNHLKQEPELVQSVKSEPTMLVKKEIAGNSNEAATLAHGASRSVKEQLQTEMTIKTATVHTDSEINPNSWKPEPVLVHSAKSEPAMLVKEEVLEDGSHDSSEQQCGDVTATPVSIDGMNETCSTSLEDLLNVKYESADIGIEPTVLQHMDVHYTINKSLVVGCNEAILYSQIKKSVENKLRDCLAPQNAIVKKRSLHEHQLASDCRVHVMRLNVYQCDICHAVYTDKLRLLQHLQTEHAGRQLTSSVAKVRKTNKRTAAENKATSQNCAQSTIEVDYNEAHMKSLLSFKCDKKSRKPRLLSAHNKLHQRNSRKSVTTKGTVADLSNQSGDKGIKTKQKPFACNFCEKRYSSNAGLNLHKRSHSSVELKNHLVNYETRKKHYHRHLTKNMGNKPFQCKICHGQFAYRSFLTRHMRVHTGEKPYACDTCLAKYARRSDLTMHMRVHTGEKPYECDTCHAKFARRSVLTIHMTVHTGEKLYQCRMCNKRFATRGNLTKHMRVHTGDKPYQCRMCDKKFAERSNLTTHIRVHTGAIPYECIECHAKFAQTNQLNTHMRIHTGEKRYECDACHAKFALKCNLTTHIGKNHTYVKAQYTSEQEAQLKSYIL